MQHIVAFLSFSRVISTDKISAQLSMYLDFSGRYLYCKDSLMYKTTPPPFLFNLEQDKISYPSVQKISLSLSHDSERAMTSNLNSRAVMLSFNFIKLLARLLQLKCINEN